MSALLGAVFWRYTAIAAQFFVVLFVVRQTPIATAGEYFGLFGFVAVAFAASGLGAPDGLVKHLPSYVRAGHREVAKAMVRSTLSWTLGINLGLAAIGALAAHFVLQLSAGISVLFIAWWFGYAVVFCLAQVLTGLIRPTEGAFIAYSAISFCYLGTQVPYLLLAETITLEGLIAAALTGTFAAAVIAAGMTLSALRSSPSMSLESGSLTRPPEGQPFARLLLDGFPMMISRLMQASLPWIPVWALLTFSLPAEAAVYAAASRLTVGVTAVVAALRFSVRPEVVLLNEDQQFDSIARLSRRCSALAIIPPMIGLVVLAADGDWVVGSVLGDAYSLAATVLAVLMLGVLAEAFGGMSDEILKMTGHTRVVVSSLAIAVLLQISGGLLLAEDGAVGLAACTALAFAAQYGIQVVWLARHTPIRIWAFLPNELKAG